MRGREATILGRLAAWGVAVGFGYGPRPRLSGDLPFEEVVRLHHRRVARPRVQSVDLGPSRRLPHRDFTFAHRNKHDMLAVDFYTVLSLLGNTEGVNAYYHSSVSSVFDRYSSKPDILAFQAQYHAVYGLKDQGDLHH